MENEFSYTIELMVVDYDNEYDTYADPLEEVRSIFASQRMPSIISPAHVIAVEVRDAGEYDDNSPFNADDATIREACMQLFNQE